MVSTRTELNCDFCGLPVSGVGGRRPVKSAPAKATSADAIPPPIPPADRTGDAGQAWTSKESRGEAVYCCTGCRMAAAISQETAETGQARSTLTRLGLAIFFAMNVMVFTMALWSWEIYAMDESPAMHALRDLFRYACLVFSLPVLLLLGGPLLQSAITDLARRRITTDILLILGVFAAFGYSALSLWRDYEHLYFEVGCMILVAVTLGRWLEATGKARATRTLQSLRRLLPARAMLVDGAEQGEVPLELVSPGALIRVLAGQRVPLDGVVERAAAVVDEQIITGELDPHPKQVGDTVYGGSANLQEDLYLRVTHAVDQGTIQRLIQAVSSAAATKSRAVRLADVISSWFVPLTAAIAMGTFVVHWQSGGFQAALLTSLSVVLIACPCALGIATPLAVWAAVSSAARHHVLLRDGDALTKLAQIRVVCFDKTGTLTSGNVELAAMQFAQSADPELVIRVARELAASSTHLLSRGLWQAFAERDTSRAADGEAAVASIAGIVNNIQSVAGLGVRGSAARRRLRATDDEPAAASWTIAAARADSRVGIADAVAESRETVWLGSVRFAQAEGCTLPADLAAWLDEHPAEAVCCVAWDRQVQGIFLLRERFRDRALPMIAELRRAGLELRILTGDRNSRGRAIEASTGIATVAELLPDEKLRAIRQLHEQYGLVAMVGDGINDVPALTAADVAIALESGADISRDAADVCLLGNSLDRLPWLVHLARETRTVVRTNLFWAFAYNLVGIGLAAAGWLNPILAAIAMIGSSLFVIGNSLRLTAGDPRAGDAEQEVAVAP